MTAALAFHDLSLGYDRRPAVRGLQCEIALGSLTALIGPNGAGKSTLLRGITGSLRPLEGKIRFGRNARDDVAYLPQQSEIDRAFPLSVFELVAMGLWRHIGPFGSVGGRQQERVTEAIAAVGLTGFEDRSIATLSGGQMQRVLFARLLLQDADIVLLDEPFTAIDLDTARDLIDIVKQWHGEGRTILAVLHDYDLVRAHFPESLLLARELVAHGPTQTVLTSANLLQARQMCEACDGPPHVCGRDAA